MPQRSLLPSLDTSVEFVADSMWDEATSQSEMVGSDIEIAC